MADSYADITAREIVTTRIFDAPRDRVFAAWTDPASLVQWWGPHGFTNTFHECDMRPGGIWRHAMHGPDGRTYENESRFVEITAPERIVIDHLSPPEFRLTVTFDSYGDRTKLTFRQLFASVGVYAGIKGLATRGNEENFDRLAMVLAREPAT